MSSWLQERAIERDMPMLLMELRRRSSRIKRAIPSLICLAVSVLASVWVVNSSTNNVMSITNNAMWELSAKSTILLQIITWIQLLRVLISTTVTGARAFSSEREQHTFEHLALTCLSSREIVDQKAAASLLDMFGFCLSSLPLGLTALIAGGLSLLNLVALYAMLLLTSVTVVFLGTLISSFFAKTSSATTAAFLVIFIGWVFSPIAFGILMSIFHPGTALGPIEFVIVAGIAIAAILILARSIARKIEGKPIDYEPLEARVKDPAIYALICLGILVLLFYIPEISDIRTSGGFGWNPMQITRYLNPFSVLSALFYKGYYGMPFFFGMPFSMMSGYGPSHSYPPGGVESYVSQYILTAFIIWAGIALLLRWLSIRRFDMLRRGACKTF